MGTLDTPICPDCVGGADLPDETKFPSMEELNGTPKRTPIKSVFAKELTIKQGT